MQKASIYTDWLDFIYALEEQACSAGMLPSEFWDEEPAETLIYIDAKNTRRQRDQYNLALLTAQLNAVNLANMWLDKGQQPHEYPSYYEVYGLDDPSKKNVNRFEARKNQLRARLARRRG